jgi:hypothetical protein
MGAIGVMSTDIATESKNTASAIWSRIIESQEGDLAPAAAEAWLRLTFTNEDHRRVDELNKKAQRSALSSEEGEELDDYIRVAEQLAVIKAKARLSLEKAGLDSQISE